MGCDKSAKFYSLLLSKSLLIVLFEILFLLQVRLTVLSH